MKTAFVITSFFLTVICFSQTEKRTKAEEFVPKSFKIVETIKGDLNKDAIDDVVFLIKGIDKNKLEKNDEGDVVDRNRRGLVVVLNKRTHFELAAKNYACFSSENEDGGVYYPPQLSVSVNKGNLYIDYEHGRNGYWKYTFRYQNASMEMIGYDHVELQMGAIQKETSINFSIKKKVEKINVNEDAEPGKEIFKQKSSFVNISKLSSLSEVEDFDELYFGNY